MWQCEVFFLMTPYFLDCLRLEDLYPSFVIYFKFFLLPAHHHGPYHLRLRRLIRASRAARRHLASQKKIVDEELVQLFVVLEWSLRVMMA